MKICFLARPCYDKVSTEIFRCMKEYYDPEVEGIFVTTNNKESGYVKSKIPGSIIYETSEYIRMHWDEFTLERLSQIEKNYDCEPIWSYIYTDRFLINRSYDYVVKMTVGLFSFFEDIFSNNNVDYYYSECIATLLCYSAYIVGKKFGVKYVAQTIARGLDATHHFVMDNPFERNVRLAPDYKSEKYSEQEYAEADKFLSDFESREVKPAYMIKSGAKPRFKFDYLLLPLKRVIKGFSPKYNNMYSYMDYHGNKGITKPLDFYVRYLRAKKYYNKADYTKKYVYFPLHFQPEASTIVCAAKYEKQLYYIDSWAKSLPSDTILYVKEHYAVLGHRELSFYKELRKYPNVVLIDPFESSRTLIKYAYAVTTLTGTAGWEAMLLRKPVFLGGNIFFDMAPGVVKVDDIYQNFVNKMNAWEEPTRQEVLTYLCAYFRSISLGSVIEIYDRDPPDFENIRNVTDSLYKFLRTGR